MDITNVIITGLFGLLSAIIVTLIQKNDVLLWFSRKKIDISESWVGWSIFIPTYEVRLQNECIYKVEISFKITGIKIVMEEDILKFYNISMNEINNIPIRKINGKGKIVGEKNLEISFSEKQSLSRGTMYLEIDNWAKKLEGTVSISNPYGNNPGSVYIILFQKGKDFPEFKNTELEKVRKRIIKTQYPGSAEKYL